MPVPANEIVKYDCNVSMKSQSFGLSATVIVALPDGMDQSPTALEWGLFRGVLKRLKVVATEMPTSSPDSLRRYQIQVSTERGYHLGNLSMTAPFSTGWHKSEVNLGTRYMTQEIEGYIEAFLHDHLAIRVNQRTPPLSRVGVDPSGKSEDLVYSWPQNPDSETALMTLPLLPGMRVYRDTWVTEERSQNLARLQREDELLRRMVVEPALPALPARDVAKREQADRIDVASRGGSAARDVAEMGRELDL